MTLLNKAAVQSYMNPNVSGVNEWCAAISPAQGLIFSTGPADAQTYLSRYDFASGVLLDYADINTLGAGAGFQCSMLCDPTGLPWVFSGGSPYPNIAKLFPGSAWALGETWGNGGDAPDGTSGTIMNAAWLQVGNAGYLVTGRFADPGADLQDILVAFANPGSLGFASHIFQNTGGTTSACAGPQGPQSATAYWTVQPFSIYGTAFGLGQTTITSAAATWPVSEWPTPNPYINSSQIKSYAPTDFDPGWSAITGLSGPAYDQTDGNVIVQVTGNGGASGAYIAKLSTTNGDVLWTVPVVNTHGFDQQAICSSVIKNGYYFYFADGGVFGPGTLYQIQTATGTATTFSLFAGNEGIPSLGNQVSNDTLGCIIGNASWNETGDFIETLNDTPSSGASLAAVYFFGSDFNPPVPLSAISYTRTWGNFNV